MRRDLQTRLVAFFDELKRRKVIRVAVGYAAGAFVVAQAATTFFPALHLPEWTVTFVVAGCVIGFPVALILAWAFDVVPANDTQNAAAPALASRRYRWVLIPAGVVLVSALAVGLIMKSPSAADDAAVDPELIAIFPFSGSVDPSVDYLRDGIVDLLAATMGSVGATHVVHPRTAMDAWQRRFGAERRHVPPESALVVARSLRASRFVIGSIVGAPAKLTVTAEVFRTSDGRATARGQVAKPADSLQAVVDQLTAQLLALEAGERRERLANLTSTSLDALSEYLLGQAAFRKGAFPRAGSHFDKALEFDSTFALAAAYGRMVPGTPASRARRARLAWTYRQRLPPSDQALLVAWLGEQYPAERTVSDMLRAWETYLGNYPDRADAWVEYGEQLLERGAAGEIENYMARTRAAFNRALALDSTYTPGLDRLISIAMYHQPNRAEFERLYALWQRRGFSADVNPMMNWARAVVRGDSARMASQWRTVLNSPGQPAGGVLGWVQHGVGKLDDAEQVIAQAEQRGRNVAMAAYWFYLNTGRPAEAARFRTRMTAQNPGFARVAPMLQAIFYGGDATAGRNAADSIGVALATQTNPLFKHMDACVLGHWRLRQGETSGIDALIATAAAPDSAGIIPLGGALCAQQLRALRSFVLRSPDARAQLERLDSAAVAYAAPGVYTDLAIMTVAHLREEMGDRAGALRAIRRFQVAVTYGNLLAPLLRERGRLALANGDTDAAIPDWSHFLALHERAERAALPQVESIRQQMRTIVPEPRR